MEENFKIVQFNSTEKKVELDLTTSKNVSLISSPQEDVFVDFQEDNTSLMASWDKVFDQEAESINADNPSDALVKSLFYKGVVDIEYIASICNMDVKDVIFALRGAIYQNPERWEKDLSKGWETADEYLSGNLIDKWKKAVEANKEHFGLFDSNIAAIESLLPPKVNFDDIYITLGTPWIPKDMVCNFAYDLLRFRRRNLILNHDEKLGVWEFFDVRNAATACDYGRGYVQFGTKRISALELIEKCLNNQEVVIRDPIKGIDGKTKYIVNNDETMLAADKQARIRFEFKRWLHSDISKMAQLVDIYTEKFGCIRTRNYDGSFLTFPNMDSKISLYSYQKNAVARILFSPNTLLAHDVGAGKTFIMVAAGMELKRMGISKRNMYVVPNNIISQWEIIFKTLYPTCKLFIVTPSMFKTSNRQKVLSHIIHNDYDAIIIGYSCFDLIPLSLNYQKSKLLKEINELKARKEESNTKKIRAEIKKLQEKYNEMVFEAGLHSKLCFDDLQINTLFVDEAHNYKNLPFDTQGRFILGVNNEGSKKCQEMLEKVRCVQSQNNGRGVVFATGTPITNSISDIFVMQKYLQPGLMEIMGISSFDAWIGNFAELAIGFEIDVDTNNYRLARRFTKFHNLPELTSALALIADFYKTSLNADIPNFNGYINCRVPKTKELAKYLKEISKRADDVRKGRIKRTEDNMLKITTDGRKAALDIRLADKNATFNTDCKIFNCADNVYDIYLRYYEQGGTQLVFCDTSTPNNVLFNAYDELKRFLVGFGIPEEEIAFVHSANTEKAREKLFEAVNSSKIRVLIGSTWKLGMGVNVQKHLVAIHHLDIPWRPADMVQREGRILRQGNENEEIFIYRYITEGSFDAYSWQLLETKQRFIDEILAGSIQVRAGNDIGDTVLGYAEVKALAIGNPLIKERVEVFNELSKYINMQRKVDELKQEILAEIDILPSLIDAKVKEIENISLDIKHYKENKVELDHDAKRDLRTYLTTEISNSFMLIEEKVLCEYQGFKIIIPINMTKDKPYVYLQNVNKYRVNVGMSLISVLIRIDKFLDDLELYLDGHKDKLLMLENKQETLKVDLVSKENYTDTIKELSEKLAQIDEKLGVKH